MPPGRAWAPAETLKINGHDFMVPGRFEPLRNGRIELVVRGFGGPRGKDTYGLEWQGERWVERWDSIRDGYLIWPTLTPEQHQMLVWKTVTLPIDNHFNHLVAADVVGGQVTQPDTIATIESFALAYTGTSWGDRKWVTVRDYDQARTSRTRQRFFRSDTPGRWEELARGNDLGDQVGWTTMLATTADSVLAVTSSGVRGLLWGWLVDTTFTEVGALHDTIFSYPMLRRCVDGTLWLFYTNTLTDFFYRKFRCGEWSPEDTLDAVLPDGVPHYFYDSMPSQDHEAFPAIMTEGYGIRGPYPDHLFVSFPTDGGFGSLERVECTTGAVVQAMGMDENGDVWLAWYVGYDGIFFTHSYTTSSSSTPAVTERDQRPWLVWTLSAPAPRTWWGILRSVNDGPFERVARVRAGPSESMAWGDSSAPAGARLRYAIRRECRDLRYEVTSEAATWEPRQTRLDLSLKSANPSEKQVAFEIVGAAARGLDVRLYDLQGRVVQRERFVPAGSGRDTFTLSLAGDLRSGIYVLRVQSDDGARAEERKIVVLR